MNLVRIPLSLAILLTAAVPVVGCAGGDDVSPSSEPRSGEATADLQGTVIEIAGAELDKDQIHAIAQAVEQRSGAHMAKVRVEKTDADEPAHLMVEIWSPDPLAAGFEEDLRGQFDALASAQITRADLGAAGPELDAGSEPAAFGPDDDEETIRQKVIADLRAKGVEGDITVNVVDLGDGKRSVEVDVEDRRAD